VLNQFNKELMMSNFFCIPVAALGNGINPEHAGWSPRGP